MYVILVPLYACSDDADTTTVSVLADANKAYATIEEIPMDQAYGTTADCIPMKSNQAYGNTADIPSGL